MTGLVAVSYCFDTLRWKGVIENPIDWQVQAFARSAGLCPCAGYDGACRFLCMFIMLFSMNLLSGCGTTTIHSQSQVNTKPNPEAGQALASIARSLLGVPYRWGGTSRRGLDCSGLVQYAHLELGIDVPRNSQDQLARANPVHPTKLHPGDLVFFKVSWRKKSSHVGIYTGEGRFIHAPSSGKPVSYASLQNPFWKDRLVAAGRFY